MRWIAILMACSSMLPAVVAQETAESCTVCHRGPLSLGGRDVDELAATIEQMRDGVAEHPAPIPDLDAEQIQALAAALATP